MPVLSIKEQFVNIKVLYVILACIFLLPLANFIFGIHPPRIQTDVNPERYGLVYEQVSFHTMDGLTLRGWFIPAASASLEPQLQKGRESNACATILVGHGYPFDKANILHHVLFLHQRFHLLLYDFRYFGESNGSYTTAGLIEAHDVDAAVTFLKGRKDVDQTRIGAMGFSMSASAFILAQHPGVKAIVADSPYATLESLVERQFFFLPGFTKWPMVAMTKLYLFLLLNLSINDARPVEAVKVLESPLLLIHGDADSQIPVEQSRQILSHADQAKTELWIVPGADHGFAHAVAGHLYEIKVRKFFEQHLCPTT